MEEILEYHFAFLKNKVLERISEVLNEDTAEDIITHDLFSFNIKNQRNKQFLEFYLRTINNEEVFFNTNGFFRLFKSKYALQGIDNYFLDNLEAQKPQILKMIRENELSRLYFEKFFQAKLKFGDGFRHKDLGSFFTKLVHTFRPDEYCALDNPVKSYFGLNKESYFVGFSIVSAAYRQWAMQNQHLIDSLKKNFFPLALSKNLNLDPITDIKLLDMIFWSKGNSKRNG